MSILRSYFSKNNTIISNSTLNTGRNPVADIFYGSNKLSISPAGFSRFIFDIDFTTLFEKVLNGTISTSCPDNLTHTLTMTNTIKFNNELLNSFNSDERKRASSFDLILFRIPKTSGTTGNPQYWDEGVGYDFTDTDKALNNFVGVQLITEPLIDNPVSDRPSNWFQNTNLDFWSEDGIYNNKNESQFVNYDDLVIVDIQHFDKGNEDINFNMTNEINGILNGTITDVSGWGIAFRPEFETITGLTSNYSVSFFTRHTQTFYEPYLLTTYNDLVEDDRNLFVENSPNKLYLFAYINGDYVNLDQNPTVTILDPNGDPIPPLTNLSTCRRTKGVYEVNIPPINGFKTPCQFTDVWSNIKLNGETLQNIENDFALQPYKNKIILGVQSKEPEIYGFDFYGIKQDEKILNTDIRKVGVVIKKAYTPKQLLKNVDAYYRVFVREGNTEVQVQDWTKLNRTTNEYYFIFDTRDKLPNEYFVDIKMNTSGVVDTYKRTIKFQIVNKK
jgi:hypothetical protein